MRRLALGLFAMPLALACGSDIDAGGGEVDGGVEDDPLVFDEPAPAGSLEALQRDIIQERCSGQPGLCHNGQFEPNLSTTSNTYAWLVRRPAIENFGKVRVDPGNPDGSFLVDKIRNINGVSTQMPLGAEPLTEAEMQRFEDWITDGALRAPGAAPPAVLNNPPKVPELGVFIGANRVDAPGAFTVPANSTLRFRHSVEDFETADGAMFLGGIVISTQMGNVLLAPGVGNQDLAGTTFDSVNPPMGNADLLNWFFDVTFGPNTDVIGPNLQVTSVATSSLTFTPIVLYIDVSPALGGIIALRLPDVSFNVQ